MPNVISLLDRLGGASSRDRQATLNALSQSQAMIEFDPQGRILDANANFLQAMGYRLDEIRGQHHRLFMPEAEARSDAYAEFWRELARGKAQKRRFKRLAKGGREVWLEASYNPVLDRSGRVVKVVKIATDISAEQLHATDMNGQVQAIRRVMGVISFDTDGKVLEANDNFLKVLGYSAAEIVGQHHSKLMPQDEVNTAAYRDFWTALRSGEFRAGLFRRRAKSGKDIWIEASYNPILDAEGRLLKVVKYATDVTERTLQQADNQGQLNAIHKVQAVIEFEVDGTIRKANANFLQAVGYSENEIVGKHHRLFVEPGYAASADYQAFWKKLASGEPVADRFKRIGKGGKVVWLQASYNPIFDPSGKVYRVIKFATDITEQVNLMNELQGLMRNINERTGHMSHASGDISAGTQDLASRTEEQAANLEGVTQTMQSVTSMVRENSDNAREARELANSASQVANQGQTALQAMMTTMGNITSSSQRIGDIIGLIDGIAFQTNILALNAAVEAARAGDQGRGFAVVASEVRSLAQRSAQAAKDIKQLIEQSSGSVKAGNGRVAELAQTIRQIAENIESFRHLTDQISSASESQREDIEQVGFSISEIETITQQNAALAEEATAATESLDEQLRELQRDVTAFMKAKGLQAA